MEKKDIALIVENLIQFQYIKNGIDELIKRGTKVDIYVPSSLYNDGFNEMFNTTYDYLEKSNYSPKRETQGLNYKILLEPYPLDKFFKIKYDYRIKYQYSLITAKPNPSLKPDWNIFYDAILCYSKYEAEYLKAYSTPIIINNLKNEFKKQSHSGKPNLLYLPTYGNLFITEEVLNTLQKLKKDYNILIKFHHGTTFLNSEKDNLEKLKNIADKHYDLNTELSALLSMSDVVLSDNSGAIFEAIYNEIPVALFADNINKCLENFDTTQSELVKLDIIPYTDIPNKIEEIVSKAISEKYIKKQINLKNKLFPDLTFSTDKFVNVINDYLNNNINIKYKQLHDILVSDYKNKLAKIDEDKNYIQTLEMNINKQKNKLEQLDYIQDKLKIQNEQIQNLNLSNLTLNDTIIEQNLIIKKYENRLLYKLSTRIYRIFDNFFSSKHTK